MRPQRKTGDPFAGIRTALIVCPHTDDEFGCAGTAVRLCRAGVDVHYVALSRCEESVPEGFKPDVLESECRNCAKSLGIPAQNTEVLDYKVRHFPAARQEILEDFVRMNKRLRPDLVLLPSSYDTHQDHSTVYHEGFRAFKSCSILGYELPQNLISFSNSAFVSLSGDDMKAKVAALRSYRSQLFRKYAAKEFIYGLARVRGVQANSEFAEAFELVRWIIR